MLKKIGFIIICIFALIGASFIGIFFAVKWGFTNTTGIIDTQRENFLESGKNTIPAQTPTAITTYFWQTTPEWQVVKSALIKDKAVLYRSASTAGVPPRLIVSALVVEQLRMFNSDRESYKKFFEPLKILGSQTQFSWGVMGTKEETAIQIEQNLKNKNSPYYLGESFEHILDFKTDDIKTERFTRITDQRNHYFSYLYAGLYFKQIQTQWKNAGFDISKQIDILATLYNIGFKGSKPNANPQSGGAEIQIADKTYSFGSLALEFYNSNELVEEFPRE